MTIEAKTGYGPISLRRDGTDVVVEVQKDGKWVEIIRQDTRAQFCTVIEARGIEYLLGLEGK